MPVADTLHHLQLVFSAGQIVMEILAADHRSRHVLLAGQDEHWSFDGLQIRLLHLTDDVAVRCVRPSILVEEELANDGPLQGSTLLIRSRCRNGVRKRLHAVWKHSAFAQARIVGINHSYRSAQC